MRYFMDPQQILADHFSLQRVGLSIVQIAHERRRWNCSDFPSLVVVAISYPANRAQVYFLDDSHLALGTCMVQS